MLALRHALTCLLLAGPAAPAVLAQEDAAAEKPAIDVDAELDEFREAIHDRKAARDQEAIAIIDKFLTDDTYEKLDKRDKAAVLKALGEALTSRRVRRTTAQTGLYVAAATALGRMGHPGARMLKRAYDSSKFRKRDWVNLRAVILKQIGKTEDESMIEFLVERARRDPEDAIMAAAGQALGNFEDADLKIRKDIVKDLIRRYGQVYGQSKKSLDPGDPILKRAKETLAAIADPWNTTLARLTRRQFRTAEEWQHFWNKNKNKNWDKPDRR